MSWHSRQMTADCVYYIDGLSATCLYLFGAGRCKMPEKDRFDCVQVPPFDSDAVMMTVSR